MPDATQVTRILQDLAGGRAAAAEELFPLVYDQLLGLARSYFRSQRSDHTLQPTALVHEAYARLAAGAGEGWAGRAHFLAVAARAMRQILIRHARDRAAEKRGGAGRQRVTLYEGDAATGAVDIDLLALEEALEELATLDERQAQVVELRYFGGLSVQETAGVLGIAERTVELDWRMARAWLAERLQ